MATFTATRAWVCAGGNHVHISVTDGTNVRELTFDRSELARGVDDDEIRTAFRVLIRSSVRGLTPAQVLSKLQTGVVITVS